MGEISADLENILSFRFAFYPRAKAPKSKWQAWQNLSLSSLAYIQME